MLKPARANSCTVASWSDPFGKPSVSTDGMVASRVIGRSLRRGRDAAEEARPLSRVAHVAVAETVDAHEHGVVVAVGLDVHDRQLVTGGLALGPERLARA